MNKFETVLITGASSGIGCELAKIFAQNGYNLILIARNIIKLNELACELMDKYDIKVYVLQQDLLENNAAEKVYESVTKIGKNVDILINNAGIGYVGSFHKKSLKSDKEILRLNIVTLTELTKLFSKDMVKLKKGKILNVASTGSFSPGPFTAVYYATKAYVLSFSMAISEELKPYNVMVSVLCPGATRTNFSKRAGKRDNKIGMSPDKVARIAYFGLLKNKRIIIPGIINKILTKIPGNLVYKVVGIYQKKLMN